MSDRVCVRGCVQEAVHYAACPWDHVEAGSERAAELTGKGVPSCDGCAPRGCRDGSMSCDRCFGRMLRLLDDTPDLLGRLRSLADPRKATPTDQPHFGSTAVEPVAPAPVEPPEPVEPVEPPEPWVPEVSEAAPLGEEESPPPELLSLLPQAVSDRPAATATASREIFWTRMIPLKRYG